MLNKPKPATVASFAAFLKIRTASFGEEIRITSSVRDTVTEIALGSLNNLVNLLRLARSYLFRFGADSAINSRAFSTADLANKQVKVELKNEFPNPDIRYVLGDKNIDHHAVKYTAPIEIKETTVLKASLFQDDKPVGKTYTDTLVFHKGFAKKVKYLTPYNQSYKGDANTMVNTIRGSKNFHDGQWQAWLVNDMELVIDLEKVESIEQVKVGALESQGAGVNFPIQVKVLISTDGVKYQQVGKIVRPYAVNAVPELKDFKINFQKQNARFVKVIGGNLKKSPKGESSWLFVDEILID